MQKIERPESNQPMPAHAKRVFKGVVFDVYQWDQQMYDGTTATFEKIKRADTAVVFPVLPDGRILLIDQEQPGKRAFIGAPCGRVKEGEDILEGAKRELLEETGYEAKEFVLWHAEQPISKIDWAVFTFVAKGCKKVAEMNLDAGEKIKLRPVTFDEFIELGCTEAFSEKEIVFKLQEARAFPEKKEALRKLFS